jgi:polar amino acid transport system substrate-binding protein
MMGNVMIFCFSWGLLACQLSAQYAALAPQGTLRMVYLASNPAQAVRDAATGEIRGVAADLTRELGRRAGVAVTITPSATPQTVIDAVNKGEADIGFVAYAPSRTGTVEFSQTYMLVRQTFLVPERSSLHSVDEIDREGLRIGGTKGNSITMYLRRTLKRAKVIETEGDTTDVKRKFEAGEIDAFGANRQELTAMANQMQRYRLLPDNILDVPQTIVVPKGRTAALAAVNAFIDEVRRSGFLKASIERSGVVGIDVAPVGYGYGKVQ